MSLRFQSVSDAYEQLSSLYKNPTRNEHSHFIDGVTAPNVNEELFKRRVALRELFDRHEAELIERDESLYYKSLTLLFELDLYWGLESPHRHLIVSRSRKLIKDFANQPKHGIRPFDRVDFTKPRIRSELKAKIRCCVAAIESRRRDDDLDELARELTTLQQFIKSNLDQPNSPAFTTSALVLSAQARLARQKQDYKQSQRKLLGELRYLNKRAAEITDRISELSKVETLSDEQRREIEDLKDDLVFIRRKQTLSSFFNVGLAAFQRGFLKTANYACESARLQFRLHGQFFQQIFNDLIILSIKRARTSRGEDDKYSDLKKELVDDVLSRLDPHSGIGNPKLYLYGLRELAVLQYYCKEMDRMIATLDRMDKLMEEHGLVKKQWKSRVSNQRARILWRIWIRQQDGAEPEAALDHAQDAFEFASGLTDKISEFPTSRALSSAIERSKKKSLIDTIESLVTYGTIRASAKQFTEAIKSANAVIHLAGEDNTRLWAMGYLVRAEAYIGNGQMVEARQDIEKATALEKRIDHRYVADRRRLVQRSISPLEFFFSELEAKDFTKGKHRLLGWFIETHSKKRNRNEIHKAIGVSHTLLTSYRDFLIKNPDEPYRHLIPILTAHNEPKEKEASSQLAGDMSAEIE
jgi:hypothetical protein